MKIIAFYLPQFHTFPENDEWWGEGFTEWTNVKKAEPLFEGHNQPRIPLGDNYYNLTDENVLVWQAELAKKYGVYGFCYYHYWFDGHMLMEKPMELMLNNKKIDIPFCICWANENWTKAWADYNKEILISQTYSDKEDWKRHFEYFLKFFKDDRYIFQDGKPVLVIYRPEIIPTLKEMLEYWDELAKQNGLQGITYMCQHSAYDHMKDKNGYLFDYAIEYQPGRVKGFLPNRPKKEQQSCSISSIIKKTLNSMVNKLGLKQTKMSTMWYSYDDAWKRILKLQPEDEKSIPGAFVDWDNSPRYGGRGSLYIGVTPEKFRKYLSKQIIHAKRDYKKDILFIFAWNEWGEGGYLEPDKTYGYGMLEAIQQALIENDEFPVWD